MRPTAPGAHDLRVREFSFGQEDFDAVRDLVKAHTGIHLSEQKRELVYGRLSRRLRALGLRTFREYREVLRSKGSDELKEFCNAITTNLTSFFRESHHFDFVRHVVRMTSAGSGTGRIRFWCAGCSTGEEPYSLAMTIHAALGDLQHRDIRILATDLDTDVLAKAQRGVYAEDRLRGVSKTLRSKFFQARNDGSNTYAIAERLRSMITFKELNLIRHLPMKGPFDAIFCRNVVIYFDKDTQHELFAHMARLQKPGGLLFLGHSEGLFRVSEAYSLVGKTIYRRN